MHSIVSFVHAPIGSALATACLRQCQKSGSEKENARPKLHFNRPVFGVAPDYPPIPAGVQSNAQGVRPNAQLSKA
jgi:hypothetical protein